MDRRFGMVAGMRALIGLVAITLGLADSQAAQGPLAPDFHLLDANTNSLRKRALVSPRDYLLQVSGYYFGGAG